MEWLKEKGEYGRQLSEQELQEKREEGEAQKSSCCSFKARMNKWNCYRNKCCSKCSINNNSSNSLSWCNIWWCPWYNSKPKLCRICWIRTIKQFMAILQGKHKNNCHRNFLNHLLFNNIFQKVATLGILSIVSMIVNSICVYLISEKKNSVIMSQHRPLYV